MDDGMEMENGCLLCPYNKDHKIRPQYMAMHLIRCGRQFKNKKLETCEFNSTHLIPKDKMREHMKTCPNRRSLESYMVEMASSNQPMNRFNAEPKQPKPKEGDEDWTDDCVGTYNAQEAAKMKGVLRPASFILKTPAEKRKLRAQERKRLIGLDLSNTSMTSELTSMSSRMSSLSIDLA